MNVLVIGNGGREHAIVRQISLSPQVNKIYCAPGNGGIQNLAENVAISVDDIPSLINFAKDNKVELTIVGPELPLTLGIVDQFEEQGLKIFGPSKAAAEMEGSKIFMKDFCSRHNIPTAHYGCFEDLENAKCYLKEQNTYPIVVKSDGLAAGKGVVIAESENDALLFLKEIFSDNKFQMEKPRVVIEEFLEGEEASYIVLADGEDYLAFTSSQDHKRAFDGDQGLNTGGMGAYAPAPIVTNEIEQKVLKEIIEPTLKGMKAEGRKYKGFLYAGLMISSAGVVKLLEYNCRLGDPEAEVLLPLCQTDFVDLMLASIEGRLKQIEMKFNNGAAVCVVLASQGYPGAYKKGFIINGLETTHSEDVIIFHSGTKMDGTNVVTNGGRVLTVTAVAESLQKAVERVYQAVPHISWEGVQFRRDIGQKGLNRLKVSA